MAKKVNKKSSNENMQLTSTGDPHREWRYSIYTSINNHR